MGDRTGIEWTDATWNPVTGCSKVSQGCKHCYAERLFPLAYGRQRIESDGVSRQREFTDVVLHYDRLDRPLHWKRPQRIFVNSMSDLFHEAVPFEFICKVIAVAIQSPRHTFQILTKRPDRMLEWSRRHERERHSWPAPNVQLGVSCEDQATADERIRLLLQTPAVVRFVSAEPLLGPIDLRIQNQKSKIQNRVDWLIAGGESGPQARPMQPDWVRSLRDQCVAAGVPFFFKQWGEWAPQSAIVDDGSPFAHTYLCNSSVEICERGERIYRVGKKRTVAMLDGREWKEFPAQIG